MENCRSIDQESSRNGDLVLYPEANTAAASSTLSHPANDANSHTTIVPVSIFSNSVIHRTGLALLLAPHIELSLVGSYPAELGPSKVTLDNPPGHVVLLDGSVGAAAAAAWTTYWRTQPLPARVLVLELANDIEMILTCIEAGASGYTLQGASMSEVAQAIREVHKGLAWCPPEITIKLFERLAMLQSTQPEPDPPSARLTAREREVLGYVAEGFSNQEIANALAIEVCTVKHHMHNLLAKLQVRRRRDAAQYALERGWLTSRSPALQRSGGKAFSLQ